MDRAFLENEVSSEKFFNHFIWVEGDLQKYNTSHPVQRDDILYDIQANTMCEMRLEGFSSVSVHDLEVH